MKRGSDGVRQRSSLVSAWGGGLLIGLAGCAATGGEEHYQGPLGFSITDENPPQAGPEGWLCWRGPLQNGTSNEVGLPDVVEADGTNQLWTYPIRGRGTPVINRDRLYGLGYSGEGADLREALFCLDARTGEELWVARYNDFISDVVYDRYSIGAPAVDPETGNIFCLSHAGLFMSYTPDGELRWQHVLGEELGRMSFPNGRTGAPTITGDLVIFACITSHWGPETPAHNRFYAFDKYSGEHVWTSSPGERPVDNPYSQPVVGVEHGERVLYAGTGCGNIVCISAATGELRWRFKMSIGGVCAAPVVYGDSIIAWHNRENVDSSQSGRMVSIPRGRRSGDDPVLMTAGDENWRADLGAFTSSPVLAGNRIYATTETGELACANADTGQVLWHEKLAAEQIHASPLYADGKLYVPMNNGTFHIVRPSDAGPERLCDAQLAGACLGAPAAYNGRVYVHTTEKLYCFGTGKDGTVEAVHPDWLEPAPGAGAPVRLRALPGDILLAQGDTLSIHAEWLDAVGERAGKALNVKWSASPNLKVDFAADGHITARQDAPAAVGMVTATAEGKEAKMRVRIVPKLPIHEDFEGFTLDKGPEGDRFALNNPAWIGTSKKWEVRERDGSQVFARNLETPLFQRTWSFFGTPDMTNYTMQLDIMTDGNRRTMSDAGIVNQRYLIGLIGNHQKLEISSNEDRIKVSVPFKWRPGKWYTLKTRVDVAPDGSGVVRAKVWERGTAEPADWTLEVPHHIAHTSGSPGIWSRTPQTRFRVYVDNIDVVPNE